MIDVNIPAWALNDLKRKFYPYEMTQDASDPRTHFIYTATTALLPLKTIGQIKFVLEEGK